MHRKADSWCSEGKPIARIVINTMTMTISLRKMGRSSMAIHAKRLRRKVNEKSVAYER